MQIKPKRGLSAARLQNVQNVIVESIAEKRQSLASLSGSDATATLASIANLERMLVGAFEMGAQMDAPDEQRETDESGAFNVQAIAAQHRANRYGHSGNATTEQTSNGVFSVELGSVENDPASFAKKAAEMSRSNYGHAAK
jgi:hypothetical protein